MTYGIQLTTANSIVGDLNKSEWDIFKKMKVLLWPKAKIYVKKQLMSCRLLQVGLKAIIYKW